MTDASATDATRVFPTLRYRDAQAMIDWLQRAFGFSEHVVYRGEDGTIAHAQLACGSGMIMLGQAREDDVDQLFGAPQDGARPTGAIYVAVDDADAHHAVAKAAGAEIVMQLTDTDYGSRDYICRDPEGHVWCFGTYWPRASEPPQPAD